MSNKNKLALLAKAGDKDALEALIPLMYTTAKIIAAKIVQGRRADQEEMVADSVSRIQEILDKWNPKMSKFASFSEVCIRNYQINTLRKLQRWEDMSIDELADDLLAPEDKPEIELQDLEGLTVLGDSAVSTLSTMSPSQRNVVLMVLRGKSISQIASEYGIRDIEAKARIRNAVEYILFEARIKHPELVTQLENAIA